MCKARCWLGLFFLIGCLIVLTAQAASIVTSKNPSPRDPQGANRSEVPPLRPELMNPKTVEPISGHEFRALLNHLQGNVVLVNLWATWCIPCIREFPDLSKLQQQYKDRGLRVIAVSLDEPQNLEAKVKPFVKERAPSFVTYLSKEPESDKFVGHLDPGWSGIIPTSYLIDRGGNLKATLVGRQTYEAFESAVVPLLQPASDMQDRHLVSDGRGTKVMEKRSGEWLIVHTQMSRAPTKSQ